jgi:transposase
MSKIPTQLTAKEFARHVEPHLSKARRGFICKIPLFKVFNYILYLLHTGCQWDRLPIDPDPNDSTKPEISWCSSANTLIMDRLEFSRE